MRSHFTARGIGILCGVLVFHLLAGQVSEKDNAIQMLLDSAQFYRLKNPQKTIAFAKEVLARTPEEGHEKEHIDALLHCANSEKMQFNFPASIEHCNTAVRLATRYKDVDLMIRVLFMKASVFDLFEQLDSSIVYHQKVIALDYPEARPYFICNAYTNIGLAYMDYGNAEEAEKHLLKGVQCSKPHEYVKPFALIPLIRFYGSRHDIKYLPYLDTLASTEFAKNATPEVWLAHFDTFFLLDSSSNSVKEQRLREVCDYLEREGSVRNYVQFGQVLVFQLQTEQRLAEADSLLLRLVAAASQSGSTRAESYIYKMLSVNCRNMGQFERALDYFEAFFTRHEQLTAEDNRTMINELNVKFETAQKDQQIQQQQVRLQQEQRGRYFLIALVSLASALSVLLFLYLRHRITLAKRLADQRKLIHEQEISHLRKEKEFSELRAYLEAREKERNRIARDLHDEIGSTLSSIHVYSSAAIKAMEKNPDKTPEILDHINRNARDVMENMSDIVWAINTGSNGEMSLEHKLKNYSYELLTPLGITCSYAIAPEAEAKLVQMEVRKNILLISKEAMNNIAKYSGATEATVGLQVEDEQLVLTVSDNGRGIPAESQRSGHGLLNMQQRTESLGGRFVLDSAKDHGTTIQSFIPLTSISEMRDEVHV